MFRRRSSSRCNDVRGSGRYSSWGCDGSPPPAPPPARRKPGGLCVPSTARTSAAGSLLSHSDAVSAEPVEQAAEGFVGLDCRDLRGGRLASHDMPHPPLKSRPTGALAPVGDRAGRRYGGRPILGRRLPQEDATNTCAEVRRTADGERVDVEWCLLKPGGVVGDEHESAEADLAALHQNSARNQDQRDRKNRNFSNQALRFLPQGGRQLSWF